MGINLKSPEAQFALELIRSGAGLAGRVRIETSVKSIIKPDHSPVTLADMGIQAIAGALLEQYLPEAVLVAEEDTDILKTPEGVEDLEKITAYVHSFFPHAKPGKVRQWIERGQGKPAGSFWTLDPIDGTKGFLRGGQYATALAFIRDGKVGLAAIGCPGLELQSYKALGKGVGIFAARGQGCWAASLDGLKEPQRWVRLEVSECREIRQARILDSFDPGHKNAEKSQRICKALGTLSDPILMDSMVKHAVIASGDAEIFFRTLPRKEPGHREKIWDVAAGALAIEEAGGRVTDLEGRELDFGAGFTLARNPGLVATNGFLHEAVLEVLRQVTQA
ncbi:MAG: inositol monophosphatase family protein [Candidatus Omnitrophota bacterium]